MSPAGACQKMYLFLQEKGKNFYIKYLDYIYPPLDCVSFTHIDMPLNIYLKFQSNHLSRKKVIDRVSFDREKWQ